MKARKTRDKIANREITNKNRYGNCAKATVTHHIRNYPSGAGGIAGDTNAANTSEKALVCRGRLVLSFTSGRRICAQAKTVHTNGNHQTDAATQTYPATQ